MAFSLVALDHVSFSSWPFLKINHEKTENTAFAEFKYLKKTNYTVQLIPKNVWSNS